jgi:hypothetical protein
MKFIADISKKTWTFENSGNTNKQFYFSFRDNGKKQVEFENLNFGIIVLENNKKVFEESFPKEGCSYISSDQDSLDMISLDMIKLGKSYKVNVWAKNKGDAWEDILIVDVPITEKVYDSWSWDENLESWVAPKNYPQDGNLYQWDEQSQEWIREV